MLQTSNPLYVEDLINDTNFNIDDYCGYVYMTYHDLTGRKYIGKKVFHHTTTKKLGKKELIEIPVTRGKRPTKKTVVKESDWKTYYGSNTEVKSLPKDEMFRIVLRLCKTKKELTYYETKYLFDYNVLENDIYMNDNILGKFYRKDLL
jgi:hypothetical protein